MVKTNRNAPLDVPTPDVCAQTNINTENKQHYQNGIIPIDKIVTEGQLIRFDMDSDHVIELSTSIAVNGLLEPIVVRPSGNQYQLIAGAHRLAACKRLGWQSIPCTILSDSNTAPIKSLALIENIIRRNLSLEEECDAVKTLLETQNLSINQICDLLGKSRLWVQQRIAATTMPADVREPLFEGLLSMKVAEQLCEVTDESARKYITNQAIYQRLGSHAVGQIIQIYHDTPSISAAVEKGIQTAKEIQATPPPQTNCGACGRKIPYAKMRAIFICIDETDCSQYIQGAVDNADTTRNSA